MLLIFLDLKTTTNGSINVYMIYLCPDAVVFQLAETWGLQTLFQMAPFGTF